MTAVAYGLAFPATRGVLGHAVPFTPSLLPSFTYGDWWDPSDLATLWQDAAGTTPVTAADQQVGKFVGQKNGIALTQATGTKRPYLRNAGSLWWLEFDGVDDYLAATFTLAQPLTDIMAVRNISYLAGGTIWDGGAGNAGRLYENASSTVAMHAGSANPSTTDLTVGDDHVATCIFNGASSKLAVDNGSYATGNAGGADPGGLTLGAYAGDYSHAGNIRFYGGISIGRALTDAEIADCRSYFGAKAGLTL